MLFLPRAQRGGRTTSTKTPTLLHAVYLQRFAGCLLQKDTFSLQARRGGRGGAERAPRVGLGGECLQIVAVPKHD